MDEWAPLPQRANKRSRHSKTNGTSATAAQTTTSHISPIIHSNGIDQHDQTKKEEEAEQEEQHQATSAEANISKVTAAVEQRAALHRISRGDDMGNDGVAGEFYEYLDHTADVQLHAWGASLKEAFEHIIPCMSNYMTDISTVEIDESKTQTFEVEGHDLQSLLFAYLDEFLFRFSTESFVCKVAEVLAFDRQAFKIKVKAQGEGFSLTKHPQGTEIKAITYSNMQIHESQDPPKADLYVIVDI